MQIKRFTNDNKIISIKDFYFLWLPAVLFLLFGLKLLNEELVFSLLVCFTLLFNFERSLLLVVFTFPFYGLITISGTGFIPLISFVFIIKALTKKKITFNRDYLNQLFALLLISYLISSIIFAENINVIVKIILQILIIIILRGLIFNRRLINSILISYTMGCIVSIIVGLLLKNYSEEWINQELGVRFLGSVSDPNYFSRAMLFATGSIFYLLRLKISNIIKLLLTCFLIIIFYGITLSISKMGLLGFLLLCFTFICLIFFTKGKFQSKLYLIFGFGILLIFVINYFDFSNYVNRFSQTSNSNLSVATTGRFALQAVAFGKWIASGLITLLFGYGINYSFILTANIPNVEANVLHSIYVQTLIEQGIFGFIVLLLILRLILKNLNKNNIFFIVVFFVTGFALSGLFYWDLIFFYIIFDRIGNAYQ